MKRCLRCGRLEQDTAVYCPSCGDSFFEPVPDNPQMDGAGPAAGGTGEAPRYGQPQQPPYQRYGAPYPPPYYKPVAEKTDPVTVGDFLIFNLLMLIPVFNIVYLIIAAMGGPRFKPSLTNYARAALIWLGIGLALAIIVSIVLALSSAPAYFPQDRYYFQ